MKRFIIFLFLLLFVQSGFGQSWTPIGAGTSVAELGNGHYALRVSGERLNYDSTGQGDWCVVDPTVCHFDPPVFGYNYGVCTGEYWTLFPDSSDGAIAFATKKGRHALTLKLAAAIYYSHSRDSVWTLATASKVAGAKEGSRINYPNTLPNIDWSFQYQNDRLKTGIVMKQAARNSLPDPSIKGWTDNETWVAFAIEMKTYSFTGGEVIAMPSIAWDTSRVSFSHSGVLQFILPKDIAYLYSDPSVQTTLYRRLKTIDSKTYLLVGMRYTTLQNSPSGAIVFDPSPVTIGDADIEDAYGREILPTTNYSTSASINSGCWNAASGYHRYQYIKPDLSSIPSEVTITTALCSLYCYESGTGDIEVLEIDANWVPAEATWNVFSTGNNWATGGGDFSNPDDTVLNDGSTNIWLVAEVENIIQSQLDGDCYGLGFRNVGGGNCVDSWKYWRGRSTEYATAAQRPRFYIEYTVPSSDGQGSWKNWGLTRWGQ